MAHCRFNAARRRIMPEFENENEDLERRRALQKEVMMIEFEREPFAAIEQFIVAMIANGYTEKQAAARCREMVTDALISFRRSAAVKARRDALRCIVGDVHNTRRTN
jgi:hypothetical protein